MEAREDQTTGGQLKQKPVQGLSPGSLLHQALCGDAEWEAWCHAYESCLQDGHTEEEASTLAHQRAELVPCDPPHSDEAPSTQLAEAQQEVPSATEAAHHGVLHTPGGGMFQPPRLRIKDKLDPNPGGLSSTEQFFNVCFCAVSFRFRRFVIRMM